MDLKSPSSYLPPVAKLINYSAADIEALLLRLEATYWPNQQIPGKPPLHRAIQRIVHDVSVPDSGYASAEEEENDDLTQASISDYAEQLDILRSDPFERNFAIKWLTGLVCRSDTWTTCEDEAEAESRSEVVDSASSVLSRFSGTDEEEEAACSLTRTFDFPSSLSPVPIKVELNDAPLSNTDHTSVGLQSWACAIVLAERICAFPSTFGLERVPPGKNSKLRILELGAGTGMLSIAVAKLLPRSSVRIVATDYHPDVLVNLQRNVDTNFPDDPSSVEVQCLDWQDPSSSPLDGEQFDVILAADVVYDPLHASWIKQCVEHFLAPDGLFSLMIAIRSTGRHEDLHATVDQVFAAPPEEEHRRLALLHTEYVGRKAGLGRADEGGYRFFQIGYS